MFSDYNGYFKGGRTGEPRRTAVGETAGGAMPLRDGGTRAPRGLAIPDHAGTGGWVHQKNNTSAGRRGGLFPAREKVFRSGGYIRSIMALPNPEQETWVAPGMRRAKS